MHERIHKSPADSGIKDFRLTLKRGGGFAHHKRRARHRLHAARNQQLAIARLNGAGSKTNRVQPRSAQAVNGGSGHRLRQPGQQGRHARYVAVIFPRLVSAAENHIVDPLEVELGIAGQQRAQRHGTEIVGPDCGKRAAVATHRGSNAITNKCVTHQASPVTLPPMR